MTHDRRDKNDTFLLAWDTVRRRGARVYCLKHALVVSLALFITHLPRMLVASFEPSLFYSVILIPVAPLVAVGAGWLFWMWNDWKYLRLLGRAPN